MKNVLKFIALLVATFSIASCMPKPKTNEEVYQSSPDVVWYQINGCPEHCMRVTPFEYKGHKYIMFGGGEARTIVHDPDCPCDGHYIE